MGILDSAFVVGSDLEAIEMWRLGSVLVVLLLGAGCATAASPRPVVTPAAEAAPPAVQPVAEPVQPSGPGEITVNVVVDGQPVTGTVRLLTASGGRVGEGPAGRSFEVEPGVYRAYGSVSDRSLLADTTERRAADRVTVAAGQSVSSNIEFTTSRVRLTVVRGNRPVRGWRVELRPAGSDQTVLEVTPSSDYLAVTAGNYSAIVYMGRTRIEVGGLVFPPGSRIQLPIRIQ